MRDRRLMREAQVDIAFLLFVGYVLHEALPDHSALTRILATLGRGAVFRDFERTVRPCIYARIAKGEVAVSMRL